MKKINIIYGLLAVAVFAISAHNVHISVTSKDKSNSELTLESLISFANATDEEKPKDDWQSGEKSEDTPITRRIPGCVPRTGSDTTSSFPPEDCWETVTVKCCKTSSNPQDKCNHATQDSGCTLPF